MANYDFTYRTNYFRVKDEDAYQEFIKHIRNISPTEDFSEVKDGIVLYQKNRPSPYGEGILIKTKGTYYAASTS